MIYNTSGSTRSDIFDLIGLTKTFNAFMGDRNVSIGLIDGPVDLTHKSFQHSYVRPTCDSCIVTCTSSEGISCHHGTFILGVLTGMRESNSLAICPNCEIIIRPIFHEHDSSFMPISTPRELSAAIIETIEAGSKIINISAGVSHSNLINYSLLYEAYEYALKHEVLIVIAAGNGGRLGHNPMLNHQWVIPVTGCDNAGRLLPTSNYGSIIRLQGFMAPGSKITSTSPNNQYSEMSGTSVSVAIVSGALALLWSRFPQARASDIKLSLMKLLSSSHTIMPSVFNIEKARNYLIEILR